MPGLPGAACSSPSRPLRESAHARGVLAPARPHDQHLHAPTVIVGFDDCVVSTGHKRCTNRGSTGTSGRARCRPSKTSSRPPGRGAVELDDLRGADARGDGLRPRRPGVREGEERGCVGVRNARVDRGSVTAELPDQSFAGPTCGCDDGSRVSTMTSRPIHGRDARTITAAARRSREPSSSLPSVNVCASRLSETPTPPRAPRLADHRVVEVVARLPRASAPRDRRARTAPRPGCRELVSRAAFSPSQSCLSSPGSYIACVLADDAIVKPDDYCGRVKVLGRGVERARARPRMGVSRGAGGSASCTPPPGNPGIRPACELPIPFGRRPVRRSYRWQRSCASISSWSAAEAPLVAGLADELRHRGIAVFGRAQEQRRSRARKPSPRTSWIRPESQPRRRSCRATAVRRQGGRALAAERRLGLSQRGGAESRTCTREALGQPFHVEELLEGEEVSIFALLRRQHRAPPSSRPGLQAESARATRAPTPGGMGSYSPVPRLSSAEVDELVELLCTPDPARAGAAQDAVRRRPLRRGHADAGRTEGARFNCRFGDPETQSLLPRLDRSLLEALAASAHGDLRACRCRSRRRRCSPSCWRAPTTRSAPTPGRRSKGIADAGGHGSTRLPRRNGAARKGIS